MRNKMNSLPTIQPGDSVEIIAPAARCSDEQLSALKNLLTSWNLECIVNENIFGNDLLCANSDEMRFQFLKNALENTETKAIICARGGYGSMRLIPELSKLKKPSAPKLFLGMSDITALNLFFYQKWNWSVLHGALSIDKFTPESIQSFKKVIFGEEKNIARNGSAMNSAAEKNKTIEAKLTGGNLCLVQTSLGTLWQMDAKNKIIFLEEITERGYRIDRMLEQLQQAGIFSEAAAIIFGDFKDCNEPDGSSKVDSVLNRFAQNISIPVIRMKGFGHGPENFPMIIGSKAILHLGKEIKLIQ
jgi:muramoyltetrapeptide carboxypeptidase